MFDIIIQLNKSEPQRVTKDVDIISTVTGTLKDGTDIINPVILLEADVTDLVNCNYLTIASFKRSYFVNNIKVLRTALLELSCHVDVLSSFANEIKANNAIIRRQQNVWNLYLNDGTFRVYQNPNVLTKSFPSGFSAQEFVLAVAGGAS